MKSTRGKKTGETKFEYVIVQFVVFLLVLVILEVCMEIW